MTQTLTQREHDYFAETAICANCYIVANINEIIRASTLFGVGPECFIRVGDWSPAAV